MTFATSSEEPWDGILDPGVDGAVWELFHENAKTSRFDTPMSEAAVVARMRTMSESLTYAAYPRVELPAPDETLPLSLTEAIIARHSARGFTPVPLQLRTLATLLYYTYGVTRSNEGTIFPRPFRVVPSAGALYPLELYFSSSQVEDLPPGLYHYNPAENCVEQLSEDTRHRELSAALVQRELPTRSSVMVFITSMFERSTFKYGDRGYRFALLEAGHVAENLNLVSTALGLASLNVGGYFDRMVDQILGLDGVVHSTVYMMAIGQEEPET
jgi:SagB-type dehydrogenase family enzyme